MNIDLCFSWPPQNLLQLFKTAPHEKKNVPVSLNINNSYINLDSHSSMKVAKEN